MSIDFSVFSYSVMVPEIDVIIEKDYEKGEYNHDGA